MKRSVQLNTAIPRILVTVALGRFGFLSGTRAVIPPSDSGYPGGNTTEGQNALFSLSGGNFNTAVGLLSLRNLTAANLNTAIGVGALVLNTSGQNTATGAGALLLNTTGNLNTANGTCCGRCCSKREGRPRTLLKAPSSVPRIPSNGRSFRRDAETSTRDARAPQTLRYSAIAVSTADSLGIVGAAGFWSGGARSIETIVSSAAPCSVFREIVSPIS